MELSAGDYRLVLDAATGGAIASLRFADVELLRPVADPRLGAQHGRAVAGYPLMPYANRIGWGRFGFAGRDYQLARNFGDHPHTIHGNAWMHPWTVLAADAHSARLGFDHVPDAAAAHEWPFAYHAEQHFGLSPDGLTILLLLANRDSRAWPAGLGLHPYVARTPRTSLRFEADTFWTTAADALPCERRAVQGDTEFDRGRDVAGDEIDNCFAGWGGEACVTWQEHGLSLCIEADPPLDHVQLYTPAGRDFIGLEPVSNMPDAINRMDNVADQGLRVLAPDERLAGTIRFRVDRAD